MVNVEGSGTDGAVTTLSPEGTLVHTNHYVCEAMLGYEDDPAYARRSARRYSRGSALLAGAAQQGLVTSGLLRQMLADHENAPDSICRHPDAVSGAKTVFWCITDVKGRSISFGRGNPCDSDVQTYRFPGGGPR